jgi:hypothetical protein
MDNKGPSSDYVLVPKTVASISTANRLKESPKYTILKKSIDVISHNKNIHSQNNRRVNKKKQQIIAPPHLIRQIAGLVTDYNELCRLNPSNDLKLSLRTTMRGLFDGDKAYHIYVGYVVIDTAYTNTGSISQVHPFYNDISQSANWSALSAIFDEYAYIKSEHSLVPIDSAFNVATPYPTLTAFDDDGGQTPSSLYSGGANLLAQYPTCKLWCPALQGATLATQANSTGFKPIKHSHKRPYPLSDSPAVGGSSTTSTGWVDIASYTDLAGCFMVFNAGVSTSTNANAYWYFAQYEVAFRLVR